MRLTTVAMVAVLALSGVACTQRASSEDERPSQTTVPTSVVEPEADRDGGAAESAPRQCLERAFSVPIEDVANVFIGDFDGDGTVELVAQHHSAEVLERVRDFGSSSPTVTRHDLGRSFPLGPVPLSDRDALVVRRLSEDGIAAFQWRGADLVRLPGGTARLRRRGVIGDAHCPTAQWFDVDRDGVDDPIAFGPGSSRQCSIAGTSGERTVWIGRGTAAGSTKAAVRTSITVPETIVSDLRFGDIDGDGTTDAVVLGARMRRYYATEQARLAVYFGRPDGSFEDPMRLTIPQTAKDLHVVDIDGDGDLELGLTAGEGDRLTIVESATDRSFSAPRGHAPGPRTSSSAFFVTFALLDVDDDGRQELLESRPDGEGGSILSLFAFDGGTYDNVAHVGGGNGVTYRLLTESMVTFGGRSGVLVEEREAGPLTDAQTQLALWSPCQPS